MHFVVAAKSYFRLMIVKITVDLLDYLFIHLAIEVVIQPITKK